MTNTTDIYDTVVIRTKWTQWYVVAWLLGGLVTLLAGWPMILGSIIGFILMWQYREIKAERAERLDFENFLDSLETSG